jgi:hypothetical protein
MLLALSCCSRRGKKVHVPGGCLQGNASKASGPDYKKYLI